MNAKMILDYVKGRYLSRFLDEKGQGIVEYALIIAFVVVVATAISSGGDLQKKISETFSNIVDAFGTTESKA